jgi:hypothetical protein
MVLGTSSALQIVDPSPALMATTAAAVVTTSALAASRFLQREKNLTGAIGAGMNAAAFPFLHSSEGLSIMAVATALFCLANSGTKGQTLMQWRNGRE